MNQVETVEEFLARGGEIKQIESVNDKPCLQWKKYESWSGRKCKGLKLYKKTQAGKKFRFTVPLQRRDMIYETH